MHPFTKSKPLITITIIMALLLAPANIAQAVESLSQVRAVLGFTYVDPLSEEVLTQPTIEKTLEVLGDPYTTFMTSEEYKKMQDSLEDVTFSGLGIKVEKIGQGIEVLHVIPDSPSEKSGLLKGDVIIRVDNIDLVGKTTEEAVVLLRGVENTVAELQIKRGSELLTFMVKRAVVNIPTIEGALYDGSTAYIRIDTFGQDTMPEFAEMVKKYNDAQVSNWIIDIRGNMGGYLSAAQDLAGYFIGGKNVTVIKGRTNTGSLIAVDKEQQINGNVILLVNEYSASASELLAAALKDNNKALIIGNRTFGKGSVQTVFNLKDTGTLKVTIGRFYSPQGKSINNMGVLPHLTITDDFALDSARLLLAQSKLGDVKIGYLSIRMFGNSFEIDLKKATASENIAAFQELVTALPENAIIMEGTTQGWVMSSKSALDKYLPNPINTIFTDIAGSPVKKEINALANPQLIQGYPDGNFYPEHKITRSEMAALLVQVMGFKLDAAKSPFTDVKAANWYAPYIDAAYKAKLITGESASRFNPEENITREEAAVMIARAMKLGLLEIPFNSKKTLSSNYSDFNKVSKWAAEDVTIALNNGILKAGVKQQLNPAQTITRGEAASMTAEMLDVIGRIE